jgi:hypothetical protein
MEMKMNRRAATPVKNVMQLAMPMVLWGASDHDTVVHGCRQTHTHHGFAISVGIRRKSMLQSARNPVFAASHWPCLK